MTGALNTCLRYSAPAMAPAADAATDAPDQLTPDSRRWRMLTVLAAGGGIQSARDNYRATQCQTVSNRANCVAHWKEVNAMLELGWVACKGGILRLRSEGRAALQRANARTRAEARARHYADAWAPPQHQHHEEHAR